MRKLVLGVLLSLASLQAQDISGVWQGTLGDENDKIRLALRIDQGQNPRTGLFFSLDRAPDWGTPTPVTSIEIQGTAIKFQLDAQSHFEGTVSSDGRSITGAWVEGGFRQPLTFQRATPETEWKDQSPHSTQFVAVGADVRLEVLDWGGSGRPVVLLAGLGNTAHIFDGLAAKLAASYHVYGVTRRGFGASSAPASGYGADELADDVLRVIDSLRLEKPVLVGHSIAGQELSSIGSRHPDKVAGLVYVDAGYSYAYYDSTLGDADLGTLPDLADFPPIQRAVMEGKQKYTRIQGPVLAIYAFGQRADPAPAEAQANAFEKGVPSARVARFPRAEHYIFLTDEAVVLGQIDGFIATLPR